MEKFEYQNLTEADSIRLLIIHPGNPASPMHCSLINTSLMECRMDIYDGYTALSYVWGDPNARKVVFVNGHPFLVTVNLADALDHLRDSERPLRLWADAICINQDNPTERTQQVGLMREIYRNGRQTVVYLGHSSEQTNTLLENIRRQGPDISLSEAATLASRDIVSRSWFTRVWTYQEAVLPRVVFIQIGRLRVLWEDLCGTLLNQKNESVSRSNLESKGLKFRPKFGTATNQDSTSTDTNSHVIIKSGGNADADNLQLLRSMNESRQKFQHGTAGGSSLFSILVSRRGMGASDFRDIIYGHLAVAEIRRTCGFNSHLKPKDYLPVVDYTKSVDEVFTDAAFYIVVSTDIRSLWDILFHSEVIDPIAKQKGLPSWVPDWTLGQNILPDSGWPFDIRTGDLPPPLERYCNLIIPVSPRILAIHCGFDATLSIIGETARPVFTGTKFDEHKQVLIEAFTELIDEGKGVKDIEKLLRILWETIGVGSISHVAWPHGIPSAIYGWIKYWSRNKPTESEIWQSLKLIGDITMILLAAAMYDSSKHLISERTFARTSRSPYSLQVGRSIVPRSTERGDLMLQFNSYREGVNSCGILRPIADYKNDDLDREIKVKLAQSGLRSDVCIVHCTYVGQGFSEAQIYSSILGDSYTIPISDQDQSGFDSEYNSDSNRNSSHWKENGEPVQEARRLGERRLSAVRRFMCDENYVPDATLTKLLVEYNFEDTMVVVIH
ncbi:hypothetical protein NHQ30_010765 [Ciborinia camelliae]|nr:hypothetical protein NHQ30_010765 [Ciborinia camelliae]